MKPVNKDSLTGKDIVAYCCDAQTGEILWQREIPGRYMQRLSGAFSDSSSPPAVCDGERVIFVSASGSVVCFDLKGKPLWSRDILSVGRTLPFLHQGNVVFTEQIYPPNEEGEFTHENEHLGKDAWTQLLALDVQTGKEVWTTECGLNMGCSILPQKLSDGRSVVLVGRGGGHSPPERPEGVSMVNLADGSTIWTLPLEGFMSTQTNSIRDDQVFVFHKDLHLTIDARTGHIRKEISIVDEVKVRRHRESGWFWNTESLEAKKDRMIIQGSNLLVGKYHYFRSYTMPYLGRIDVDTGKVEHLELPLQLSRTPGQQDQMLWYKPPESKADKEIRLQMFAENEMKNSRGLVVFSDKRSKGNGWGHIASPAPSVAGNNLYIPVMSGTVYVIRWNAKTLDEDTIVAINDLGPVGQSWTRASLSFADGNIFAHTIRELLCISGE
ncbi:MAG: PQQ-binding-like beta-propeller repeat protein [Verrucomicrobiae bacterium]|nr:PQQ-binding-like beta-propeller repeat protein [Verrucomicrobiae bacterium]